MTERAVDTSQFTIPNSGDSDFVSYGEPETESSSAETEDSSLGLISEYGDDLLNVFAKGGVTGTGIAEGYNQVYDWLTGWGPSSSSAAASSAATSSGTFGGSNIANAGYGVAGGFIADELFDGEGYSSAGGTLGASLGASAAVGSGAIGTSLASLGWAAGPIGALGGALLGGAIGSLFGSDDIDDMRFATYSGELGSEVADINLAYADNAASISEFANSFDIFNNAGSFVDYTADDLQEPEYAPGDTYKWQWTDDDNLVRNDGEGYASFDGAFGNYTVAYANDIDGKTDFAETWVAGIGELDNLVATMLSPSEIALASEGLSGSSQVSPEWESEGGATKATNMMIADRYSAIFHLAGRDDLYQEFIDGDGDKHEDAVTQLISMYESYGANPGFVDVTALGGADPSSSQFGVNIIERTPSSSIPTGISSPEGVINPVS